MQGDKILPVYRPPSPSKAIKRLTEIYKNQPYFKY